MNIFYDSNYSTEASLPTDPTFNSITTTEISTNIYKIPAANSGDTLYVNADKNITGLAIGPNNYILTSNGSTPEWSNEVDVNTVKTNQLTIPGTSIGDLFTVNASNNFTRVPIGGSGDLLKSDGVSFGWGPLVLPDPLTLNDLNVANSLKLTNFNYGPAFVRNQQIVASPNQYWFYSGAANNVPTADTLIFSTVTSCVAGRNYRIDISGNLICAVPASLGFAPTSFLSEQITCNGTMPFTIFRFFQAPVDNCPIDFSGYTGVATQGSFLNIHVMISES